MRSILVIGTGGIARRHFHGLREVGGANIGIVEPHADRRTEAAEAYGIEHAFADIADADLAAWDAAFICAPAHVHVPLARACAEAGLPFLLEKPLAVSMQGVDELVELVSSRELFARVAYVRRVSPESAAFVERIRAGEVGIPRMCYVNSSQDYRKYRPDYQTTYYAKKAMGGGVILDASSHMIDLLLWMFGPVAEVSCMYDRLVFEGTETEDSALISLRFVSGAMAQLTQNQFQKPNCATIEVAGTKANLKMDCIDCTISFADDDSRRWETTDYLGGKAFWDFHNDRFRLQTEAFFAGLDGKPCCLATLEDARHNLQIALAAKKSYDTKRIVVL